MSPGWTPPPQTTAGTPAPQQAVPNIVSGIAGGYVGTVGSPQLKLAQSVFDTAFSDTDTSSRQLNLTANLLEIPKKFIGQNEATLRLKSIGDPQLRAYIKNREKHGLPIVPKRPETGRWRSSGASHDSIVELGDALIESEQGQAAARGVGKLWAAGSNIVELRNEPDLDYLDRVGHMFVGYGNFFYNTASGLKQVASSPIQSAKGLLNAMSTPGETFEMIATSIEEKSGTSAGRGELGMELLATLFGPQVVSKSLTEVVEVGGKVRHLAKTFDDAVANAPNLKTQQLLVTPNGVASRTPLTHVFSTAKDSINAAGNGIKAVVNELKAPKTALPKKPSRWDFINRIANKYDEYVNSTFYGQNPAKKPHFSTSSGARYLDNVVDDGLELVGVENKYFRQKSGSVDTGVRRGTQKRNKLAETLQRVRKQARKDRELLLSPDANTPTRIDWNLNVQYPKLEKWLESQGFNVHVRPQP